MKKVSLKISVIVLGFASIVFSGFSLAGETAESKAPEVAEQKPFGDAKAGKNKAAACNACH